ncbi:MAG: cryptochrome/photolyase family protein, partial [Rhodospirillales bacterium]
DCAYDVKQKTGPDACPFNYLYWAFLIRNQSALKDNPRLAMPYRNLAKWSPETRKARLDEANAFLDTLTEDQT